MNRASPRRLGTSTQALAEFDWRESVVNMAACSQVLRRNNHISRERNANMIGSSKYNIFMQV